MGLFAVPFAVYAFGYALPLTNFYILGPKNGLFPLEIKLPGIPLGITCQHCPVSLSGAALAQGSPSFRDKAMPAVAGSASGPNNFTPCRKTQQQVHSKDAHHTRIHLVAFQSSTD